MSVWEYPLNLYDKQQQAVSSPADQVLFGGSLAGGKTEMIIKHLVDICCLVPGAKTLLVRKNFPQMVEIEQRLRLRIPSEIATLNKSDHVLTFKHNDAQLRLGYLDSDDAAENYQGHEYVCIAYDELTHYDESWVDRLNERIRATGPIAEGMERNGLKLRMLAASNPGSRGHCVPYGEVLTPNGWQDISTFAIGDPVYGVDSGGMLVSTHVEQVHKYEASETVEVNGNGLHMHMTPEHRVAKIGGTRANRKAMFSLVPWQDLPGQAQILRTIKWEGIEHGPVSVIDTTGLRKSRTRQPTSITWLQYAKLVGWFLSEGCLVDRDKAISIAQMKTAQRDIIHELLDECGFTQSWSKTGVLLYARAWWEHFKALNLGLCRDKFIPIELKKSKQPVLRALFDALMGGDGHWNAAGKSGAYYTTSKRLADDVAEVAVKLGYIVQVSSRQRDNRVGLSWQVNFKTLKTGGTEILTGNHVYDITTSAKRSSDTVRHSYDTPLPVYCIGVPEHHAFIIRQRGSVWVSGNSWVKERFIDPAPAGELFEVPVTDTDGEPLRGADGRPITMTRQFIPSSLWDNPYLDHDKYLATLAGMDPERKRAMIYGDWSVPAGTRFPQFREAVHVIKPEDFPIPVVGATRVVGVDYGFNDPFAAVWIARVGEQFIVYRDHVEKELSSSEQAERVLELESESERLHSDVTVALDPNAWIRSHGSVGPRIPNSNEDEAPMGSIAYNFKQALGDRVVKGWNPRVQGWALLDQLMVPQDTGMVDGNGVPVKVPRILIYDTCRDVIKALQSAPRAKRDPQDIDHNWKSMDHQLDALRYGCAELLGMRYRSKMPASERLRYEGESRTLTADVMERSF